MKETIRLELRRHLEAMADGQRQRLSSLACKVLLELAEYRRAETVMAYIPLAEELDIEPVIEAAWGAGKVVAMPRIIWERHELRPIVTHNLVDDVMPSRHGLREPAGDEEVGLEQIDLLVVPALGFDERGHRMGRGGGFYDRFLAEPKLRAKTVGITFHQQVLGELPVLSHDQAVDMIVTDEGVCVCNSAE